MNLLSRSGLAAASLVVSLSFLLSGVVVTLAYAQEEVTEPTIVEELEVIVDESLNLPAEGVETEPIETVSEEVAETEEQALAETSEEAATEEQVVEETSAVEETTDDTSSVASAAFTLPIPELSTDKDDYHPGEIVTVFGRFFTPLKNFVIRIFGNSEVGDFWSDVSISVVSDDSGSFSFSHQLDNFYRPIYDMSATDDSGAIVATDQFTDAPNAQVDTFDQCANDDGDGSGGNPGVCDWTNGNLNGNNSTYSEEDATVQRLLLTGLTNGSHTVTIEYDTTKGGKHSYDFLTDPKLSETWVTGTNFCAGLTQFPSCNSASVNLSGNIPHDPLNTNGTDDTNQNFEIRNGTITGVSVPALINGTYAGDSTTRVNVTFSVNTATCLDGSGNGANAECPALITWGAHISSQADWGANSSAVNISGSPYHVRVTALDGKSTGNRDNQMAASAIPSTITIRKVVPGGSAQSFTFTTTGTGYTGFNLVSGGSNTQTVDSGNYSVTETALAGWAVTNIQCTTIVGTGTTAVPNVANRSIAITLGTNGGNVVDCTFTNELQTATLTLLKTVVNNNGGTALDTAWTLAAAGPTPISGTEGQAAVTNAAVNAGAYTLSESGGPAGYSSTGVWSCTGAAVSNDNQITLAPGGNATCTITNTDNAPSLTLVKQVINDNGGIATAGQWTLTAAGYDAQSPDVGTYNLSESGPSGYTQTSLTCSDTGGAQVTSVTLSLGESVTCTFVNDDIAPILHLRKIVVGGTATAADFTLTANGTGANDISGTSPVDSGAGLLADTWALSETSLPGYSASAWSCVGGSQNGANITLAVGQEATCTITNTRDQGTVIVKKVMIGGTETFDFTGTPSGSIAANNGTIQAVVNTGQYASTETPEAGWDLTSISCDDANSTGNTQTGAATFNVEKDETVTCTFTNTKDSKIIVNKVTVGDDANFFFSSQYDPDGWTLSNGQSNDSGDIDAGTYLINETVPEGWDQTSATCNNGDDPSAVTVAAGETVTCTFENTKRGKIIIEKQTLPNGSSQVFDFNASWDAGAAPDFQLSDGQSNDSGLLVPGQYSVSETLPAGWVQTDLSCESSLGDIEAAANIELDAGETVTCTYENTQNGHIIVDKVTDPVGDPQSFSFTTTGTGYVGFSLTDVASPNNQEVAPGAYSIAETVPSGWDLTSATCDKGETPASLDVEPGETVTCTFNNQKDANIVVIKQTLPDADPAQFDFTASYDNDGFILSDGGQNDSGDLDPGAYTVAETGETGWDITSATCTSTQQGDASTPGAISLQAGETVTCTFTNTKDSKIIVNKVTVGDDANFFFSSQYDPDGWTLSNGQSNDSGDIDAGTYLINETVPEGWDQTSATCNNGDDPSAVTVAAGETVTCTFENTKRGKIIIEKQTLPDGDSATFGFTGEIIDSLGDGQTSELVVTPGEYHVQETVTAGWNLTSIVCSDNDSVGVLADREADFTVAAGETVTCVFTNTKKGHIIVDKVTDPSGDPQSFQFDAVGYDDFNLTDAAAANDAHVAPGNYSVDEFTPPGWDLTALSCVETATNNSSTNLATGVATIVLDPGETITCTFTNQKDANIIVKKETDPDGDPAQFDFTASYDNDGFILSDGGQNDSGDLDPGAYTVAETGETGWDITSATCTSTQQGDASTPDSISLQAGETVTCTFTNEKDAFIIVDKVTLPAADETQFTFAASYDNDGFALADATTPENSGDLDPGQYSVSETVPAGWDQTSATCSDGSPIGAISLQAGETVTCTFTNTKRGHLIVQKTTNPAGDTTSFTINASGSGTITGGGSGSVTDATDKDYEVTPGTYSVAETVPSGWAKTGDTCQGVVVGPGETKTCELTNVKEAKITLEKVCDPDDAENTFAFTLQQGAGAVNPLNPVPCGAKNIVIVAPTTDSNNFVNWTITEAATPGWNITDISCSGDSEFQKTVSSATVGLDAGEEVKCVFTNFAPPPGRMTGGGSIFTKNGDTGFGGLVAGTRITHGFQLHCNALVVPNRLEVNWSPTGSKKKLGQNNFHLTTLDNVQCIDDGSIDEQSPDSAIDTIEGYGTGKFNGVGGYRIHFVFTDAGEPGVNDASWYVITDPNGNTVLRIGGTWDVNSNPLLSATALATLVNGSSDPYRITNGNQQAHK